ncbi:hypothetical protein B7463_g12783, partial [Scytalidium lignicola]
MRPPAILSTAVLLSLALGAVAQGNANSHTTNTNNNNSPTSAPTSAAPPKSTNKNDNTDNNSASAPPLPNLSSEANKAHSTASSDDASSAPTDKASSGGAKSTAGSSSSSSTTDHVITPTGSSSAPTNTGKLPSLPTNLPKLPGGFTIPVVTVPPTANAPYMQTSSMPEGTVFIAVGSILGFMALSVLLWRGLVVWALHRSVKRAAMHQNLTDSKAMFHTPPAPLYKYSDHESTISLAGLGPKSNRKSMRPGTSSGAASNLFFSPTATTAGLNAPGNRGSSYLPAGYYAAGAAQAANGAGMAHINSHGHGTSINLSNIAAQSQGYQRARSMGATPPGSPGLGMSRHAASTSTVNLAVPPGDRRTPSTYLEDLFDGEGSNPPMPPPHMGGR